MEYNLQPAFIKFKLTENTFTKRNENALSLEDCTSIYHINESIKYLIDYYNIQKNHITMIMYGIDENGKDDEEIFLVTSDVFYGIILNTKELCKYIMIRDEIRKKSIINLLKFHLHLKAFEIIYNFIKNCQEVQYRVNDINYEWNIYFVLKNGLILDKLLIENIMDMVRILYFSEMSNDILYEFLKTLSIYKNTYKMSMIGFSKKYLENTLSFKLFLSKSNLN